MSHSESLDHTSDLASFTIRSPHKPTLTMHQTTVSSIDKQTQNSIALSPNEIKLCTQVTFNLMSKHMLDSHDLFLTYQRNQMNHIHYALFCLC